MGLVFLLQDYWHCFLSLREDSLRTHSSSIPVHVIQAWRLQLYMLQFLNKFSPAWLMAMTVSQHCTSEWLIWICNGQVPIKTYNWFRRTQWYIIIFPGAWVCPSMYFQFYSILNDNDLAPLQLHKLAVLLPVCKVHQVTKLKDFLPVCTAVSFREFCWSVLMAAEKLGLRCEASVLRFSNSLPPENNQIFFM